MRRSQTFAVVLFLLAVAAPVYAAQRVRIQVLGLFHPQELKLDTVPRQPLTVKVADRQFTIGNAGHQQLSAALAGDALVVHSGSLDISAKDAHFSAQHGGDADFILTVRDKLRREYHGRLSIERGEGELIAVIEMDLELAVASIVAAESTPGTPREALKAQAVAARSYLISGGPRHAHADFCDTTHCQFLRGRPQPNTPAAQAAARTRGLVLAWEGKPFATMYSASCGGRTLTLSEVGMTPGDYPYFAVECRYCRRNPQRWSSTVADKDAALLGGTESGRIKAGRKLGWNAVPSNSYVTKQADGTVVIEGVGHGHGIGLCERGAAGMARNGKEFRTILAYYFPNTTIESAAKAAD